ncbi:Glutamine--tRNA ligase [Sulfidibacter corallicola]|uniref:Glutamine--tRNA ligase n=1 Tax=Sulfidibacter corallicola TaxID=2818388 RepID=A0A8A4TY02_SULCO|nr:glutamine--tRNA ligase/YqeY domain fusion protein [Sulfidibacter corallicola]QTD54088.1 glutamine--tRNA ligase/YqeY domain fusion protein [Sulfidibacter corallicola]
MSHAPASPGDAAADKSKDGRPSNFIRAIIEEDLRTGKHQGRVATRFPPEPNGYLHIGHAKSICLNFGLAGEYGGTCHLRFDDTNPTTEDMEYVASIQNDIRWLGFDWQDHLYFASDYFDELYASAEHLIKKGKAYVDSLSEEEIRTYRGTVTEPGKPSPYRDRSVEENLDLFRKMRAGDFADGEHVLRAKIDMAAANMKMRDPLLYRIRHAHHYRTGETWCIYPMYDFAHCLSDSIENITHSICTLEFENNRDIYDWVIAECDRENVPHQYEFARLKLNYTVMSKRKFLRLVNEKLVSGWDDPRMPTIAGMRRRGYTAEAIRDLCERVGVAKANSTVDFTKLEFCVRNDLNPKVPRVLAIQNPLKVVIDNYPEDKVEMLDASLYPHDVPLEGSRELPFSREIYIDRDDFREDPPKKFFRLAPGREVRLRHAYIIKCEKVVKDPESGEITALHCTYDAATLGTNPTDRKVKGTIHWVSAKHAVPAEIRLYDRLLAVEHPDQEEGDFLDMLNPDSLEVVQGFVEPAIAGDADGTRYQFERLGYFIRDVGDSTPDKPVYNRIVGLRDSWAKISGETKAKPAAPSKPAPSKVEKATPAPAEPKRDPLADKTPELAAKFTAYRDDHGLSEEDADLLTADPARVRFFEAALATHDNAKAIANWINNELARELKDRPLSQLPFGPTELAELVALIDADTISNKIARDVFAVLAEKGGKPADIVAKRGLTQVSDTAELERILAQIAADHPDEVARYKAGEKKLTGFFVGKMMKATGGKANPKVINRLVAEKLG